VWLNPSASAEGSLQGFTPPLTLGWDFFIWRESHAYRCGSKRMPQTTCGLNTDEWQENRFDIDTSVSPDVTSTVTNMSAVASGSVDPIYSNHNIQHMYPHEVPVVLSEFARLLSDDGFLVICTDHQSVYAKVAEDKLTCCLHIACWPNCTHRHLVCPPSSDGDTQQLPTTATGGTKKYWWDFEMD